MTTLHIFKLGLFGLILLSTAFSVTTVVRAESVLWNTSPMVNLCNAAGAGFACAHRLVNPNITIQYHAQVTDDIGVQLAPGATVSVGTTLHLSFVPHTFEDVYWFGTGFSFDSPYGEWRVDADPPAVSANEKDFTGITHTGANGASTEPLASYRPLVVAPPAKTITSADGLGCGAPATDGSLTCTPQQAGTFTPQFNFADTFGKYYWRFKHLGNGVIVGDNTPLLTFIGSNPSFVPSYGSDGYDYHGEGIVLGSTYILNVPAANVPFPITVVDVEEEDDDPNDDTPGG